MEKSTPYRIIQIGQYRKLVNDIPDHEQKRELEAGLFAVEIGGLEKKVFPFPENKEQECRMLDKSSRKFVSNKLAEFISMYDEIQFYSGKRGIGKGEKGTVNEYTALPEDSDIARSIERLYFSQERLKYWRRTHPTRLNMS